MSCFGYDPLKMYPNVPQANPLLASIEIQKLLNGNNGGVIMDFIDNNNHKDNWDYKNQKNVDKTSIIKWDEKYYEWESGKEIVIINNK